jgi:hypothetical protein
MWRFWPTPRPRAGSRCAACTTPRRPGPRPAPRCCWCMPRAWSEAASCRIRPGWHAWASWSPPWTAGEACPLVSICTVPTQAVARAPFVLAYASVALRRLSRPASCHQTWPHFPCAPLHCVCAQVPWPARRGRAQRPRHVRGCAGQVRCAVLLRAQWTLALAQLPAALLRACGGWHAEQWRVPLRDSFSGPRCSRCTHEPPLLWCAPRLRAWHGSGEHPFILDNAWDVSRALDYLASRPDVDATRMGASGVSMGGMIAWFAAAADERLAAVAPLIGVQHFGCVVCCVCVCACACVRAT